MTKLRSMKRLSGTPLVLGALCVVALSPVAASAATDTTTINATLSSVITVTTSGTVPINVLPSASGSASSASDTVTVDTNDSDGYVLTFSNSDTTTYLDGVGAGTIPAHAGTQASPTTLATNTWGYRVDSVGGFGAGPTAAETNQANLTGAWAGVPSSASPNTLKSTASIASGDTTTVWFGVKVDTATPDDVYSDTVTYTATAN